MKKIYLIGMGTGNPEHLTLQAVDAIKKTDVFFILEKESEKNAELVELRKRIVQRHMARERCRILTIKTPERKRGGRALEAYKERVGAWRDTKGEIISKLIRASLSDGETGAMLIWGDPSLYDGHIEILNNILRRGWADFEYEVIPGITSMQVLAARHKIPLNSIGEAIHITTGRRLKELTPAEVTNSVVLLDNFLTYKAFSDSDHQIYWGGYLGTEDEVLISGRVRDVLDDIVRARTDAKKKKGWIMETYILRAPRQDER